MNTLAPGKLVIISGPSGAGKSTVVRQLLAECSLPLTMSVSATTRSPRPGERDGVDYFFLSQEEFARRREVETSWNAKRFSAAATGTARSVVRWPLALPRESG